MLHKKPIILMLLLILSVSMTACIAPIETVPDQESDVAESSTQDDAAPSADGEDGARYEVGTVVSHPSTGAMEPIEGGTAELVATADGALARMHTVGLEPGNVYTAWWVLANNPEACEASPCSAPDFLAKADQTLSEVTYADGVIVGESGEADFAAYLPVGEVTNNPWIGNGFTNPTSAEIHLVINNHGPLIPERAGEMLNTYRDGCTDESLPPPFPDTAKADGEPGPNACALIQAGIFQGLETGGGESQAQHMAGTVMSHPSTGAMEPIEGGTAELIANADGVTARMHTVVLAPGNVYTAWWVLANNPEACEASPCSAPDFLAKADQTLSEVTYADGVIVGESGEADFAAYLPVGEVTNNPWIGNGFTNPTGAEIHLVINNHGPLIPERAREMLNTYRDGCTDESLPPPFPDTAKADGEPGPNTCALIQAGIFQQ